MWKRLKAVMCSCSLFFGILYFRFTKILTVLFARASRFRVKAGAASPTAAKPA